MQQPKKQQQKQKNQLYGEQDEQSKEQIKNQTQYKNDKKRRKKKRAKPKHSPQYYQQLKRLKQNRKKQSEWDSRFNLAVIPDLFEKSVKNLKPKFKLKSLRGDDATKKQELTYKTFNAQNQSKSKPAKSFNIRIVSKKQQTEQATINKKDLIPEPKQQKEKEKDKQKQKDQKQRIYKQKMANQRAQQTNILLQEVAKVHEQLKFFQCHKNLLIQTINSSKQKTIKNFIHAEIARLKSKTSNCSNLEQSIKKRQEIIKQLQESKQIPNGQQIKRYRLSTLRVIQLLLKWRDQWQKNYYEQTHIKPKIQFIVDGVNYLSKIYRSFNVGAKKDVEFGNNPFLLGFFSEENVDNELIVRIRACEMLLLENQLEVGENQ